MRWSWDDSKNRINRQKHGIGFETASLVFNDRMAVSIPDPHADEERWRTIGMIGNVVVIVVHTDERPKNGVEPGRIISARKATPRERRIYEEDGF